MSGAIAHKRAEAREVVPHGDALFAALIALQVEALIVRNLPQVDHHEEVVEEIGPDSSVRLPYKPEYMGAELWQDGGGQVFSGPMVMGFADITMYCCVMAAMGLNVIPVMANFNITFLRPAKACDLVAEARIVRRGGRLHYLECWLTSCDELEPCAHITSTYRVSDRATTAASRSDRSTERAW